MKDHMIRIKDEEYIRLCALIVKLKEHYKCKITISDAIWKLLEIYENAKK